MENSSHFTLTGPLTPECKIGLRLKQIVYVATIYECV